MMSTLSKKLSTIAASAVLALGAGAASNAFAAGIFTVDPTVLSGGAGSSFQADFINGGSSTRVQEVGNTTNYTSAGYITFGQFSLAGSPISVAISQLGLTYGLYATFTQTFSCPALLATGVTCTVTGISLSLFGDPGNNDAFTQATLAANPSVTVVGTDVLLATVNAVISGTAGIDSLGGAFENVNTNFILTAFGSTFFTNPIPFFNFAFSNFNNSSTGLACSPSGTCPGDGQVFAITAENGGTQFLRVVPEPATLALMGIGLLGLAIARRRKA